MSSKPAKRLALFVLVIALVALFALPAAAGTDTGTTDEGPYITESTSPPITVGGTEVADDVVVDPPQAAATEVAGETLPFTGGDVAVIAAVGIGLVAAGLVLVAARRRRPDATV